MLSSPIIVKSFNFHFAIQYYLIYFANINFLFKQVIIVIPRCIYFIFQFNLMKLIRFFSK
jgi:hypothetical protein